MSIFRRLQSIDQNVASCVHTDYYCDWSKLSIKPLVPIHINSTTISQILSPKGKMATQSALTLNVLNVTVTLVGVDNQERRVSKVIFWRRLVVFASVKSMFLSRIVSKSFARRVHTLSWRSRNVSFLQTQLDRYFFGFIQTLIFVSRDYSILLDNAL